MNLSADSTIGQIRIARPTDRLQELERFYHEIVGLPKLTSWQDGVDGDHYGYDGLILGMPDARYHLEFTQHRDGSPSPVPTRDNLLVFYLAVTEDLQRIVSRMHDFGYQEVAPENPWWENGGHTFEDPDGWRIVFMLGHGVRAQPRSFAST